MKKAVILVFLMLSASIVFAQSSQKIGYVDSQIILAQYAPAIKAQSDLDALAAKWQATRDSLVQVLNQAYQDYDKQKELMTPDKQRETQQQIVAMQQQIQRFEQEKFSQPDGEYFKKNEELLAPIKERVFEAIDQVAKSENMQFVFDKAGDVILLYADEQFDLTYQVLDKLKRGK